MKNFDLITLGETLIRHYTRGQQRLEQSADLGFGIAGAESNVAIAASRLGLRCGWISKLARNPLGEKIEREIRVHGVDTSHVVWTDQGRVGTFYIEFGSPPRATHVLYDRANSAASTLRPEEVDWNYVRAASWFHTTGITCALSRSCLATVLRGIEEAHRGKTLVSFEINYREKLWTLAQCRSTLLKVIPGVDLIISSAEDVKRVFGMKGEGLVLAERVRRKFGARRILITCGSQGAVGFDHEGSHHELSFERFPISVVDRIGAGDAFTAGFLAGLIEKDFATGLLHGAATCALKYSIPGDLALINRTEMLEVAAGNGGGVRR